MEGRGRGGEEERGGEGRDEVLVLTTALTNKTYMYMDMYSSNHSNHRHLIRVKAEHTQDSRGDSCNGHCHYRH